MSNHKNVDKIDVKNILNKLATNKCVDFLYSAEFNVILYFGNIENTVPFLTTWRLFIDCAWRIENNNKVIVGSSDESNRIVNSLKILQGLEVKVIEYCEVSKNFNIIFESGIIFTCFVNATDLDQWTLRKSDGYRLQLDINLKIVEYWEESDKKHLSHNEPQNFKKKGDVD